MSKTEKCGNEWKRTIKINGVLTELRGSRIILETLPYRLNTKLRDVKRDNGE